VLFKARFFTALKTFRDGVCAEVHETNQDVSTLFVGRHILNYSNSDAWTFSFSFLSKILLSSLKKPCARHILCWSHSPFSPVPPHVNIDFEVPPTGCDRSVADFWVWGAHKAHLLCPYDVSDDKRLWAWSTRRGLKPKFYKLPRPWSLWESSPERKNSFGRTGNRIRDLMVSSQKF
jgi:hypothetical protein